MSYSAKTDKEQVIETWGLTPLPAERVEVGRLNSIEVFSDAEGRKFCLREQTTDNRGWVQSYIQDLLDSLGGQQQVAAVSYRSVPNQVSFMNKLKKAGVNVPAVIGHGPDWMMMSFMDGRPASMELPTSSSEETVAIVGSLITSITAVHRAGYCLWDRCGKNEIVSKAKTVSFIDFDVNVTFDGLVPFASQASHDLAIGVRSYVLLAQHKEDAIAAVRSSLSTPSSHTLYHSQRLSQVFDQQVAHYERLASTGNETEYYAAQRETNQYIAGLSRWLMNK